MLDDRSLPIFDQVHIAPDVVRSDATLMAPPGFDVQPDGLHILLYGSAGRIGDGGRIVQIDRAPPVALVHVLDSGPPDDPYDPPLSVAYLVRADSLPRLRVESRIGAVCQERGIDADELARRAGFPVSTARRVLRPDVQRISAAQLEAVCRALGVGVGDLLVLVGE